MNYHRSIRLIALVLAATHNLVRRARRHGRILCVAAALTTSGCIDDARIECLRNPEACQTAQQDKDGDGRPASMDCDDNDASRWTRGASGECSASPLDCDDPNMICNPMPDPDTDADGDGFPRIRDCNDSNPAIYPGAAPSRESRRNFRRSCDQTGPVDYDCDGVIDYCDDVQIISNPIPDSDGDGFTDDIDCDPDNPYIYPDAPLSWEIESGCPATDGIDYNCDGLDDFICPTFNDFPEDLDGDGVFYEDDCNDEDPLIYPGASYPDGSPEKRILQQRCFDEGPIDIDCDGEFEIECDVISNHLPTDADGDGHDDDVDCMPHEPAAYPGAPIGEDAYELCDRIGVETLDVNCDGRPDLVCNDNPHLDEDGDGDHDYLDCAPNNPLVYREADHEPDSEEYQALLEACPDIGPIDYDCDGRIDIMCDIVINGIPDMDGDGVHADVDCDDEDPSVGEPDDGGDCHQRPACDEPGCQLEDRDGDGTPAPIDCNDDHANIHPEARLNPDEPSIMAICLETGSVDVDCDGIADMVCNGSGDRDADRDGVPARSDCDDSDAEIGAAPEGQDCDPAPVDCDDPMVICNG